MYLLSIFLVLSYQPSTQAWDKNGVTLFLNNGQAKEQINRLKILKREMYGRTAQSYCGVGVGTIESLYQQSLSVR